jgi:hypothetical protein
MDRELYTLAQAAERTGLTLRALRKRADRGSLETVKRAGVRYVSHAELRRAGLLSGQGLAPGQLDTAVSESPGSELLERLERLAAENGRLKALTAIAESTEQALTDELHQARALAGELEALDRELAAAGWWGAWRIARRRRRHSAMPNA